MDPTQKKPEQKPIAEKIPTKNPPAPSDPFQVSSPWYNIIEAFLWLVFCIELYFFANYMHYSYTLLTNGFAGAFTSVFMVFILAAAFYFVIGFHKKRMTFKKRSHFLWTFAFGLMFIFILMSFTGLFTPSFYELY